MTSPRKSRDPKTLRPSTQLIHGGSLRSAFEETSEALFLTQGYLYDTMELSEARFKGEDPGFIYSRFANPTVSMFERRMALLEGAEGNSERDGRRHGRTHGPAQSGRPHRRRAGALWFMPLCCRGPAAAIRR